MYVLLCPDYVPNLIHRISGPDPLKGPFDSTGFPVGCKSACAANIDGNPSQPEFYLAHICNTDLVIVANSPNCCSGSFDTAAMCPPSGVEFYDFFSTCDLSLFWSLSSSRYDPAEGNCPNSYAYAFDESSNTALWTCDSNLNADYTLTFCP